jgi:hypothetical protein
MRYDECVRHLTIRNVPDDLAERLEQEKRIRGASLNGTVLALLRQAVGMGRATRSNGLVDLAGTWSRDEVEEFEDAVRFTEDVDHELWR